jgi:hypothetical protein
MEIKEYNWHYEFEDRLIRQTIDKIIRQSFGITNQMIHKSPSNNEFDKETLYLINNPTY